MNSSFDGTSAKASGGRPKFLDRASTGVCESQEVNISVSSAENAPSGKT